MSLIFTLYSCDLTCFCCCARSVKKVHGGILICDGVLLIPGTGNGERGTGNRERESGNECTAVIRIRIQNGGRNHGKGSGN